MTFSDLQKFSLKHGQKKLCKGPRYVLLKALLNASYKVVDNECIFFLGDHFNMLRDICVQ